MKSKLPFTVIQKINAKKAMERDFEKLRVYCKHFGCGKILTCYEYVYSDYCFKHSKQNNEKKTDILSKDLPL